MEHPLKNGFCILQTVVFKGKIVTLGFFGRLFVINLSPSLSIQQVEVVFEDRFRGLRHTLLLIKLMEVEGRIGSEVFQFNAFKLESVDAITKPARWVRVDRLDNWAIFVSTDTRYPA